MGIASQGGGGREEMTLVKEKALEIIRNGLTFLQADSQSDRPHWDARYPKKYSGSSFPEN